MSATVAETDVRPTYRIRMKHLEACNCRHGCNCQFEGFPNEGKCEFLIGYEIVEGSYGEVDLAGTRVAVALEYPGAIHEGGGRGVLFVDEAASEEQAAAVEAIWSGRAGGMPWEALAGTLETFEGPVRQPVEVTDDGPRSGFRVPGVLDASFTPLTDPVSGDEKKVQIRYPEGGFFWDEATCTTTGTMKVEYGDLAFSHPGRYAAFGEAEWSNEA